jgi:hypothetical protein
LNDFGRPYLYPNGLFEIIDPQKPPDWIIETGESGEHYAYPPEINSSGFFEGFFDGKKQAVVIFWRVVDMKTGTGKNELHCILACPLSLLNNKNKKVRYK